MIHDRFTLLNTVVLFAAHLVHKLIVGSEAISTSHKFFEPSAHRCGRLSTNVFDVGSRAADDICLVSLPVAGGPTAAVAVDVFVYDRDKTAQETNCLRVHYML